MDTLTSVIKYIIGYFGNWTLSTVSSVLRDLATRLETEQQILERLMFLNLESSVIRAGIDLKIFDALCGHASPLQIRELATAEKVDPVLLGRLLRYLASKGAIRETGKDTFTANKVTAVLAKADNQSGFYHYYDHVNPQFQALPDYLAKTGYRNLTDNKSTVFQSAYGTKQTVFEWYPQHQPVTFAHFNNYMASRRRTLPTWLSAFSLDKVITDWAPSAPLFVDVGGGIGQQCADIVSMYPALSGRVVLEDLDHCISQALPTSGVENKVQDIFKAQQVQGAKYYHLRGVLHDFPDDKCQEILRNLLPALRPGSSILVEEHVLPDSGVHWQATQLDLTMMCGLGAMERTLDQFKQLLGSLGLKIDKVYPLDRSTYESVIVATID